MTVHELSRADARRVAVRAQLLGSERPDRLLEMKDLARWLELDLTPR